MTIRITLALSLILAAGIVPASPLELRDALLECREKRDDLQRLACYDAKIEDAAKDEVFPTEREPARSRPAHDDHEAREQAAVRDFGLSAENVLRQERPETVDAISATITLIEERPRRGRVLHLDNGHVWQETTKAQNFRLEVGDEITISSGVFGGFRLTRDGTNRFSRVQRTQ